MSDKQTKSQRIAELERKLVEVQAQHAYIYKVAVEGIKKAGTDRLMASGVVLTLTALGGREVCPPVLIRDGLSEDTIRALVGDMIRSFDLATLHKPKA